MNRNAGSIHRLRMRACAIVIFELPRKMRSILMRSPALSHHLFIATRSRSRLRLFFSKEFISWRESRGHLDQLERKLQGDGVPLVTIMHDTQVLNAGVLRTPQGFLSAFFCLAARQTDVCRLRGFSQRKVIHACNRRRPAPYTDTRRTRHAISGNPLLFDFDRQRCFRNDWPAAVFHCLRTDRYFLLFLSSRVSRDLNLVDC